VITLPDTEPAVFALFTRFLKTGSLCPVQDKEKYLDYKMLVKLFNFANKQDIKPLRNTVISSFFTVIADTPFAIPYTIIPSIYAATTPTSSLRDLFVCTAVEIGAAANVRENLSSLPKEFMLDCLTVASDLAVVPFHRGRDDEGVMSWLKEKAETVCAEYHIHDTADSLDDGREDYRPRGKKVGRQQAWERAGELTRRARQNRMSAVSSVLRDIRRETNVLAERYEDEGEEWDGSEEEEYDEDDGGIQEMKRLFNEESEARMRHLLEPLPSRERY